MSFETLSLGVRAGHLVCCLLKSACCQLHLLLVTNDLVVTQILTDFQTSVQIPMQGSKLKELLGHLLATNESNSPQIKILSC